MAEKLISDI